MGVAASRDLGARLCTTPYFLLLDAHMRFYDGQWIGRIVNMLQENDRRILCCQTKFLHKKDDIIKEAKEAKTAFGAYMPLHKGAYMPDIKWNSHEFRPNQSEEPVPAVLGAGYAASKRYWAYIRGLEGLRYYGCDEIYLSLKTWLEGGQCILLKDVVIGHIYRTKSPYHHYNELEVFNYLFITQVLFPVSWRALAFATAKTLHPKVYVKALAHLNGQKSYLNDMRTYYRKIFTVPFENVLQMNRRYALGGLKPHLKHLERLPAVVDFVVTHPTEGCGLCEGKMGQLIWLCHCMDTDDTRCEKAAANLWSIIQKAISSKRLPHNFKYGLEGIGWGLIYLSRKGLLEDDLSDVLRAIDQQLCCYNPATDTDNSFLTGRGGWMAYRLARAVYFLNDRGNQVFSESDKRQLRQIAAELLEQSSEVPALLYAWQMHAFLSETTTNKDYSFALRDWMDFGDFIPQDSQYWSTALTGNALSTTLYAKLINDYTHD